MSLPKLFFLSEIDYKRTLAYKDTKMLVPAVSEVHCTIWQKKKISEQQKCVFTLTSELEKHLHLLGFHYKARVDALLFLPEGQGGPCLRFITLLWSCEKETIQRHVHRHMMGRRVGHFIIAILSL
jgi:hypothetical protein